MKTEETEKESMLEELKKKIFNLQNNVKQKKSFIHYIMFTIFVIGTSFFIFSKSFIGDDTPILNTKIAEEVPFFDTKIKLNDMFFDEKKHIIETTFSIEETPIITEKDLVVKSFSRLDTRKNLKPKIIFRNTDLVVIRTEVPEKYHTLAVKISIDNKLIKSNFSTADERETEISFYADHRKISNKNVNKNKKEEEYIKEFVISEIKTEEKDIRKIEKNIKTINTNIKRMENHIIKIKEEMSYQTSQEKNKSLVDIENINDRISDERLEIKINQETISEKTEKIKLFKKRKNDLKIKNNTNKNQKKE